MYLYKVNMCLLPPSPLTQSPLYDYWLLCFSQGSPIFPFFIFSLGVLNYFFRSQSFFQKFAPWQYLPLLKPIFFVPWRKFINSLCAKKYSLTGNPCCFVRWHFAGSRNFINSHTDIAPMTGIFFCRNYNNRLIHKKGFCNLFPTIGDRYIVQQIKPLAKFNWKLNS